MAGSAADQTPPSKKAPAVMAAFITAGALDPNNVIPTVDGVPNAGIGNLDIAWPLTVLRHGAIYVVQVAAQNSNFSGTCAVTYQLTQVKHHKKTVVDQGTINPSYACAAHTNWAVGNRSNPVPNSPGAATLVGIIQYGSTTVSTSFPVWIQ
jgi:hypothetical protein